MLLKAVRTLSDRIFAERYGTAALVRRVFMEEGPRYWRAYLLSFMLMGIVAACTSFSAYLVGYLVNATYLTRNFNAVLALGAITIAIFVIKGLASYGQAVLVAWISTEISTRNQQLMFDKLLRENIAFYAGQPSSNFIAQVSYGASSTANVLNLIINSIGRDALSLVGLAVVMVIQDPVMASIAIIGVPLALMSTSKILRQLGDANVAAFRSNAGLFETIQETVQGLRIVKAFGLESMMRQRVATSIAETRRSSLQLARLSNRSGPLMEALGGVAVALAFIYGGYRVIHLEANGGQFISFMTAFLLAYEPAKRLVRIRFDLGVNIYGVRMLYQLLDSPATEPEEEERPPLRVDQALIEVVDLEFGYRTNEPVLHGMSFSAKAGKVTALVGESGGGKSTAFNLLMRFYQPWSGSIRIDGQDTALVKRQSLRDQIAYVSQDVYLFRTTIAENIAVGRPGASKDEIEAAARAANAHGFISGLPAGYQTSVGEMGLELSAGQRQRIAIARALLRRSPIILLDEPTSALDSQSEREVQFAMAQLCANRTVLVIAHRLHTVANADCIHVVEKGTIVESGTHDELMRLGRKYAAFHLLHFKEPRSSALESS